MPENGTPGLTRRGLETELKGHRASPRPYLARAPSGELGGATLQKLQGGGSKAQGVVILNLERPSAIFQV